MSIHPIHSRSSGADASRQIHTRKPKGLRLRAQGSFRRSGLRRAPSNEWRGLLPRCEGGGVDAEKQANRAAGACRIDNCKGLGRRSVGSPKGNACWESHTYRAVAVPSEITLGWRFLKSPLGRTAGWRKWILIIMVGNLAEEKIRLARCSRLLLS